MKRIVAVLVIVSAFGLSVAQLPPVPQPPENPITEPKRLLGKMLFWEEQLSSDGRVACGTCHLPGNAGADPRAGVHPGFDEIFGTDDDVIGSPGVARADASGDLVQDLLFSFNTQVTGRSANPVVNSAYAPEAFWDGRAGSTFLDPETGQVSIANGGALENQAVGPILSDVEMAREGRTWSDVAATLQVVEPMRFAGDLPADLLAALSGDPSYPDLFQAAFGDPVITAERIGFAIATYERTLIADDTPWDRFMAGDPTAMTPQQQQGWAVFQGSNCAQCHTAPLFTDQTFRNIGVRPVAEDTGREAVTGNFADRGRFKVPTLRNVGLKTTYMHNGGLASLQDVVIFYQPGNQADNENRDPLVPSPIPPDETAALVEFMMNGLTDARVASESAPFARPSIFGGMEPDDVLLVGADRATLSWPASRDGLSYRIYRGMLGGLIDVDHDGLPDGGFGSCISATDPDPADTTFTDPQTPPSGDGYFYLRTVVRLGGESDLGTTSTGLARNPTSSCP